MLDDQPFTTSSFLGHIGRSICFAVPTGLSLWLLHSFAIKVVGRGCCPIFDISTDSANMGWTLVVNCFLAALNPMLFCLFIIWSFYRSLVEAHDYSVDRLIFFGLAPVIIYFIFAVKRGWVRHSSVIGEKSLQKLAITAIVCIAMLPLQKQILNAPSNIINSIKILTLSQHMSESGVPHKEWLRARTFAKTLGEAGKHKEAMAALIESMDGNLKRHDIGSLNEDLMTLKYIDQSNELTKDEWINLCKPMATRLNLACEKVTRLEFNSQIDYPSITLLLKKAIGRYQSHGAFDEAMHYQKISNEINRIRHGNSPRLNSRTEANLAISGNIT